MRSVQLQSALREFLEAAALRLSADLAAGAEIPFEVDQQPSRGGRFGGPSLYCYRPLITEFIAERRQALEGLPEYGPAAQALDAFEGLDRYLAGLGEDIARLPRSARVRAAIASLLGDAFAEQSDFELHRERIDAALERLHSTALASTAEVTIVARLEGMTITSPELPLAAGLTIARGDALDGLPADARKQRADGAEHLVVVLACQDPDAREAVDRGRAVLADLLRALRLFGDGRVTLGALAWARIGAGPWNALPLGGGGRPHGMLVVTVEQEDELRAFCNLVSRRAPDGNELAWALRRFELGCERGDALDALSDNLLALRAILEPEGPASGLIAGRLAALCATPQRRLALTERTVQAIALERAVISGNDAGRAGGRLLAEEVADHLRALLRDVLCGHLDPDLVGLADELLLADGPEPVPGARVAAADASPASCSEPELLGDPSEAEEILDLLI
ncbi:MAG TPA: hypothetical protein VNV44_07120 [Solirubrobacteraceae bacterium]|jgi:hypothetical protein|nr:hypothetical protein [Solirubrobacteraceae bacterium]